MTPGASSSNSAAQPAMQNPLDALEPNILPEVIKAWPPAYGWWLLALLALTALVALGVWLWLRYRRNAYRRQALQQLAAFRHGFDNHQDMSRLNKECNHLLKAVALQVWPREHVASLYGQPWLAFLDSSLKERALFTGKTHGLGESLYSPGRDNQNSDPDVLCNAVQRWIKKHVSTRTGGTNHA